MMEIILYILLVMLGIIVCALLLPVHIILKGTGSTDTGFDGMARVMLFAGLLGGGGEYHGKGFQAGFYIGLKKVFAIDATRFSRRARRKKKMAKPEERKKKEKGGGPLPKGKAEGIKAGFREKVRQTVRKGRDYSLYAHTALRDLRSVFRVDRFNTEITLGFDDPARTGQAMGILYALNGMLPERFVIRPGGDFTRRVFSGSIDMKIIFRTWLFWICLARFLWLFMRLRSRAKPVYRGNFEAQEA
jgi:hypothetical protein